MSAIEQMDLSVRKIHYELASLAHSQQAPDQNIGRKLTLKSEKSTAVNQVSGHNPFQADHVSPKLS